MAGRAPPEPREDCEEHVRAYEETEGERGYPDAKAVHSAEESLIFALPKELRRDLKAAEQAKSH